MSGDKYYSYSRGSMTSFLPNTYHSVLEVGCAEGSFSEGLSHDCEKWGVEMNAPAADKAKEKLDRVLAGSYREIEDQLPENKFDLVVCNDVIEHMPDADGFLRDIQTKMVKGGVLIGSVPNVRYYRNLFEVLVLKDWKYKDSGILDKTHQRYFTIRSLENDFKSKGYQIEILKGVGGEFSAPSRGIIHYVMRSILLVLLMVITCGLHTDIQYAQIGFRVRVP